MRGKYIRLLIMFVALMSLFISCSDNSLNEEIIQITLLHGWGTMEEDHIAMRKIYEDFEKENPGIHINLLSMPSSEDAVNKAIDMISIGNVPDIIFTGGIGYDTIYKFMVEKDYAVNLFPYIENDDEFKGNIPKSVIQYWENDNKEIFTLPDVFLMSGYWYNADIFSQAGIKEPPKTWDEFLDMCKKIRNWADDINEDIVPICFNSENSIALFDYLVSSNGGDFHSINNEWRAELNYNTLYENLKKLQVIFEYSTDLNKEFTYRDSLNNFNNNKSAIYINGVWANSMIDQNINAKYAAFPMNSGKTIASKSSCIGYIVGNTKDQDRIEASIKLVKYMLSDNVQNRLLEETGQVPINPKINIEEYRESMPRLYEAVNVVDNADMHIPIPVNFWNEKKRVYFMNNILDVLNRKIELDEFVKNIETE